MSVKTVESLKIKLISATGDYHDVLKFGLDEPKKYKEEMFKLTNLIFLYSNENCINLNKIKCYVPRC